jgi:hypothetical protein
VSEPRREITFRVWRDEFGQLAALSADPEIRAFGADRDELIEAIHEAIRRHFGTPEHAPEVIRLHRVEEPGHTHEPHGRAHEPPGESR